MVAAVRVLAVAALALLAGADAKPPAVLRVVVEYPSSNLEPGMGMGLRGDGLGLSWGATTPAERVGENQWAVDLPLGGAALANVSMKPMAGDTWCRGQNEVVVLPAAVPAGAVLVATLHPWFVETRGSLLLLPGVYSPQLDNTRDVIVYVPAAAVENPLRPFGGRDVLVAHDGQNLFNASTSSFGVAWMIQDTADPDIDQGLARPYIVVGVDNSANRTYEYTPQPDPTVGEGGGADLLLDFYEQTVYPLVASRLRLRLPAPGAGRWSMLGSSLGGLLSCYAAWTRPALYGAVGCMSSSFWWDGEHFNNRTLRDGRAAPAADWYVDSGDSGPDRDDEAQTVRVFEHLLAMGYRRGALPGGGGGLAAAAAPGGTAWHYVQPGGHHSEKYWGERFHVAERALLGPAVTTPELAGPPAASGSGLRGAASRAAARR